MVAPLDDILNSVGGIFFQTEFQFRELTYRTHKTYCSPSATTASEKQNPIPFPPNQTKTPKPLADQ